MKRTSTKVVLGVASLSIAALTLSACSGAGGQAGSSKESINVLAATGPNMQNLQKLVDEHFTKESGIKVNITLMPENDMRAKMDQEFSSQAGQYDIGSMSAFEVPIYSANGWLAPLDDYVAKDAEYNQADVFDTFTSALTGTDGKLYAEPFFGEGSFTMYRKDLFEKAGITMPENPTWQEIEELAAKVNGTDGADGICLRGLAGWGQNLAVVNTMVNTFGGTWFDEDWNARLTDPEFKEAVQFYVDLINNYGEKGAAQFGVNECLNNFLQGKSAIFYDASSLAPNNEAADSAIKGKVGYVNAPHYKTDAGGWLWTWAFGVQAASKHKDAAWEFISWATSQEYEEVIGKAMGWEQVPAGKRASLYENPEYTEAAAAFWEGELSAVKNAPDPKDPDLQPRPYTGVQYLGIPEWPALGDQVGQLIASALAGQITVDDALEQAQALAQKVGDKYKAK